MKFISYTIAFVIAFFSYSCHSKLVPRHTAINQESKDMRGNPELLGLCTKERLEQAPYGSWFNKNYSEYKIDTPSAIELKKILSDKHFIIFMGTWCGDSKREVPRMFKILDFCGVSHSSIKLIMLYGVDSAYKQSPGHEEKGLDIHRVPDLLVFSHDIELGRIVESPVLSLEKDLLAICKGENYLPNYHAVPVIANLFKQQTSQELSENLRALSIKIKPLTNNSAELNTYGYVLMSRAAMEEAGFVFRLNTLLYPGDANVFSSLAEYYIKIGNKMLAEENCRKTLTLEPDNDGAKKMMDQLSNK